MSDSDHRETRRRHLEENERQADSPASVAVVRREVERVLREIGIDMTNWDNIEDFRANQAFVRRQRERAEQIGNENRKGFIHMVWAGIAAAAAGAMATFFSVKGGGH